MRSITLAGFMVGLTVALLSAASPVAANGPVAHAAATCSDYSNQAEAQRAADTRDADGDGIYCEDLPCPCSTGSGGGGPAPTPAPAPKPVKRAQTISAQITSVVDGDTIKVRAFGARRRFYVVRLIGIDTPETKRPGTPVECGGKRASSGMYELAFSAPTDEDGDGLLDSSGGSAGRHVTLRTDPSQATFDRYGRLLAYVTTRSGVNLGARQVGDGWAEVYVYGGTPFAQLTRFRAAERRARAHRRGVWGRCGGNFHRPA
jgi:micrococcal nuclease